MSKTVTIQGQQKWEYCSLTKFSESSLINELNMLGQQGWELISMLHYKDLKGTICFTGIMKRPSTGPAPAPAGPALQAATAGTPTAKATEKPSPATDGFDLGADDFNLAPEAPE
jgi:hypothetical protein